MLWLCVAQIRTFTGGLTDHALGVLYHLVRHVQHVQRDNRGPGIT